VKTITIYPNNKDEISLYEQLAQLLGNNFSVQKKKTSKQEKLNVLSESTKEIASHTNGKLKT